MSITPTQLRKNDILYSDFRKDLATLPGRNDLGRLVNENAVREAIKNLLLTDRGERLFQPYLGSDIRKSFFDNLMMPGTLILLETRVTDCLNNFEPRCDLIAVDVTASIENNSVELTVVFSVLNIEEPQTVTIGIDRVR